ncbi:MAG: SIS domain-containing protein, partial [Erysipelotrichaceae bacterium]|nr:SIS domain-containing protein [Erysipelotrichaceae bacterium]
MIAKSDATHLSIIISYSGETKALLRVLKWLRHKNVPIMAMTSISRSTLSKNADVVWHMSSREMVNTKISYFASAESLSCLLDILYSCLFAFDYNKHLDQVFYMTEITNDKYTEDPYIDDSKMGQYE